MNEIIFILAFAVLSFLWYEKERKKSKQRGVEAGAFQKAIFAAVIRGILDTKRKEVPSPTLETLKELHKKVLGLFVPVEEIGEDWRSHADAVNQGVKFEDDCDGFAFTMCELMVQEGFPLKDILFISGYTEQGEGHAVAGCAIDGVKYVADNRYKAVRPISMQVEAYITLDDPSNWKQL